MEGNPRVSAGEYLESVRQHIAAPPETTGEELNRENPLRRLTQHAVLLALDATQREMQDGGHVYQGDVAVLQRQLGVYFGGWMREELHDQGAFDQERERFARLTQALFDKQLEAESKREQTLHRAA